jgi:hypothetical protein
MVSGPVTLIGVVGVVAWAGSAARRVGVALPDHVDVAHREVDRLAVAHLAADVVQHAVAHVDRVVQPEQAARRAVLAEKYSNMRSRPTQEWRSRRAAARRHVLGRAAALDRHEGINAAGREGDDARGLEDLGDHRRHLHVHRPGERHVAGRAELAAGHEHHVGRLGQALERAAIEQVGGDRLDAAWPAPRARPAR